MITYNDTRFIYNNEWLTYNGTIFFNVSDNCVCLDSFKWYKHIIKYSINHDYVWWDLTNYATYIDLSLFDDYFWNNVKNWWWDIRIYDINLQECPREIVSCDTTLKTGEVHTLIPSVSASSDTIIYIYYGNSNASDYAPTDTYGRNAVWAGYNFVFHGQSDARDSSGNIPNGTITGATIISEKIGKGYNFVKAYTQKISFGNNVNKTTNSFTISLWAKSTNTNTLQALVNKKYDLGSANRAGYSVFFENGKLRTTFSDGTLQLRRDTNTTLSSNSFLKLSAIRDVENSTIRILVNGQYNEASLSGNNPGSLSNSENLYFGIDGGSVRYLNGDIDEVRIYNGKITQQQELTEYNNQNDPASFYNTPIYISSQILNIYWLNSDISVNYEDLLVTRVMVISVNDEQSTTDNKLLNVSIYKIDTQSFTDLSLNSVEIISEDTVSSNDSKLIDILSNNVDIIYTIDSWWATQLLLSRVKPWVVWLDRITPLILKAIKHKPLVQ